MAEYIELIDKYRITQSKDTDYNPPSYDWVDNTGEIVRCKDCKYWKLSKIEPSFYVCTYVCGSTFVRKAEDFCSRGEKREES